MTHNLNSNSNSKSNSNSNSRFASLINETRDANKDLSRDTNKVKKYENTQNNFKSDFGNKNYNRQNSSKETAERQAFDKMLLEQEKKKKEAKDQQNLVASNFPALLVNNEKIIQKDQHSKIESYVEKVSKKKDEPTVISNYVKPGWVEIKRDPSNKTKIIYTYGESTIQEKTENKTNEHQVLLALANLYKKQTEEYINMWGYDNWEKLYRFPNHDYEYFERLDEELEMEELELEEMQNNNYYDNEYY